MPEYPSVFIASSSEGCELAKAMEAALANEFDINLWFNDVIPGETIVETLQRSTRRNDFAIVLLTADDLTISRDQETPSPRDNLVFELGWFMSSIGPRSTFFVVEKDDEMKIPSDLSGVSYVSYRMRDDHDLTKTVSAASFKIAEAIRKESSEPPDPYLREEVSFLRAVIDLSDTLQRDPFIPDLIVGVSRGGLAAAGELSQSLGDEAPIPAMAILPDNQFDNDFNSFGIDRASFGSSTAGRRLRVLVVDDFCESGQTLYLAKQHLSRALSNDDFEIRTAAMNRWKGGKVLRYKPDYVVLETENPRTMMGRSERYGS